MAPKKIACKKLFEKKTLRWRKIFWKEKCPFQEWNFGWIKIYFEYKYWRFVCVFATYPDSKTASYNSCEPAKIRLYYTGVHWITYEDRLILSDEVEKMVYAILGLWGSPPTGAHFGPQKSIFQGHCSNKLDVKLLFVYYSIVSWSKIFILKKNKKKMPF